MLSKDIDDTGNFSIPHISLFFMNYEWDVYVVVWYVMRMNITHTQTGKHKSFLVEKRNSIFLVLVLGTRETWNRYRYRY